MMFPVPYIPSENYLGGRGFGADRSAVAALLKIPGGQLKHGAVDLIVPPKTPVPYWSAWVVMLTLASPIGMIAPSKKA